MKQTFTLIVLSILFFLSSCELTNSDDGVPAKIHITSFDFKSEALQGTDSVNINDGWIYVDGDLIGAFEIPFTAPILNTGSHMIEIRPGVILNGIAGTRTINPFFASYTQSVDLVAGQTIELYPKSSYIDDLEFPWNNRGEEDFEEGGISLDSVSGSSTKIFKSKNDVYEGDYSGEIFLDKGHQNFSSQSTTEFDLPGAGAAIVMEMHIKNTSIPLAIGMFVNLPGGTVVDVSHMGVTPGPDWKKLYVNFTELVNHYSSAETFRVTFRADLGSVEDSASIYLDNIKILHVK